MPGTQEFSRHPYVIGRSGRWATSGKKRTFPATGKRVEIRVQVSRKRRWYGWSWVPTIGLRKTLAPVRNTRSLGKKDMVHNDLAPEIKVDPETYEVRVDGELITSEPASELPLAQRYFLF